jgi:polyhydroxybutyrate depolymerase
MTTKRLFALTKAVALIAVPWSVVVACSSGSLGGSDPADAGSPNANDAQVSSSTMDAHADVSPNTTPNVDANVPQNETDAAIDSPMTIAQESGVDASSVATNPPLLSPGCSVAPVAGDLLQRTFTAGGASRDAWVHVSSSVAKGVPQKVIFAWHGCNMSVDSYRSAFTIEASITDSTIVVYPQITTGASSTGSSGGETCFDETRDTTYFRAALTDIESAYCIDEHKVFVTGYSSGAIMSDWLGCVASDVVRAIAPAEGALDETQPASACPGKVDAFIIHSPDDEQIGWDQPDQATTTNPGAYTTGDGYIPFSYFYANDGCTSPALDPHNASIVTTPTQYTCALSADGVHARRLWLLLDDYEVPPSYGSNTPHHWWPPTAPDQIWQFFAATP